MEFLVVFAVIAAVIYFIIRGISNKQPNEMPRHRHSHNGIVVSSSPGASIVLTFEGTAYRTSRKKQKPVHPDTLWIPRGKTTTVAGKEIPGGMFYVGEYLQSANGYREIEPSLISPTLKVDWSCPDFRGTKMDYWPSYSGIDPACRAAYLSWSIGGRCDPSIGIGYVFIFFYGLERRFFIDARNSTAARADMPDIVAEVKRLLGLYGSNESFRGYANRFLDAALLADPNEKYYESSPPEERTGSDLPLRLRLGIGQFLAEGRPIPADWAYSWLLLHPDTRLKTPAIRCAREFKSLFRIGYAEKYSEGMVLKPNKTRLSATLHTASLAIGAIELPCGDLPDIGRLSGPVNRLRTIAEDCTNSLDPLSRYLGRKPDQANSFEALALIPDELVNRMDNPHAAAIERWLHEKLRQNNRADVNASELVRLWSSSDVDCLTKKETILLAQLLSKFGCGLEPDPRFGGTNLKTDGKAVLFRLPENAPKTASKEYRAAAVLLHLAATISGSDGMVAQSEREHLETHLKDVLDMSSGEKIRLQAHLDWLLQDPPGLAGVKRRLESLQPEKKREIAAFCVGVAGADGHIDPSEIATLKKLYPMLGIEANDIYSHIHSMMSSASYPSADSPVTVQTADASEKGYKIPTTLDVGQMRTEGIDLDMKIVQNKLEETARVSQILGEIFQEEVVEEVCSFLEESEIETIDVLDAAHSGLFSALIRQPEWSRSDFEFLVEQHGLLPDGALDMINEAAYEICDEPVFDGNDPILVDLGVAKEMFE